MSEPNAPGQSQHGKDNERKVTDPVTHLPLLIHDANSIELERIPPPPSKNEEQKVNAGNGDGVASTNDRHAKMEQALFRATHQGWWANPGGDQNKLKVQISMVVAASASLGAFGSLLFWLPFSSHSLGTFSFMALLVIPAICCILGIAVGANAHMLSFFNTDREQPSNVLTEHPNEQPQDNKEDAPESANWLNSIVKSLWPVVNPALFTSVSDMLEDALQASLPKLVHAVRVADIGQGLVPMRILAIRWLDAGSAAEDKDGMKAEEGDFVNMEIAFAYRAKAVSGNGLKERSGNAHVFLEFYVAGGVMFPVWVELTGFLATARIRIQLTPNPPFFSIMTMTLLGQPMIKLDCTPLAKSFLNIMDVPGLSGWVQNSINTAVAEYVSPRSLNVDLKTILMGREKMDTDAVGIIVVTVKCAKGYKPGDSRKLKSDEAKNGDPYVTIGWSKWGKPMWSTRIIPKQGHPVWEETTALLVGPTEINSHEALQLQLWDSDRLTADDLLGQVDIPLQELMKNERTFNKISTHEDDFRDINRSPCPGKLYWECGYFAKTTLEQHLEQKRQDAKEIEATIKEEAEAKLREAKSNGDDLNGEVEQQKREDLKERSDEIIAASRPAAQWPTGILSIRIEQISGLEIQKIRESGVRDEGEDHHSDDLPSAYCTVIINHQQVYKTRTKMKTNNPFYDAGTENFVRDWRNATVLIAVRDSRLHETDPLLGVIALPLRETLKHRSQLTNSLPLVGGIGYGRVKFSLTFRSVQTKLSKCLLGWDVVTLEIQPTVKSSIDLPTDFSSCRLVFHTAHGKGKMIPNPDGGWKQKAGRPIRLAISKRYASCLLIQLRKHVVARDVTPAFCSLWLKDIPDDEEVSVSLPVWKNEGHDLEQARTNAKASHGEQLGTLDLKLRLWPGLSGYHHFLADHDRNMADVMDALDCAEESKEVSHDHLYEETHGEDSDSSSGSEHEEQGMGEDGHHTVGAVQGIQDYRRHEKTLHRKHRGLMQWNAARNVAWVGRGLEHQANKLGEKISGTFKHKARENGVAKEA